MIIYHTNLVKHLSSLNIPVYFELFDEVKELPCITYMEISNVDYLTGDTIAYSDLTFMIKIWGKTVAEVATISASVDELLKPFGFKREFSQDSTDNNLCVKIMRFNALGIEQ